MVSENRNKDLSKLNSKPMKRFRKYLAAPIFHLHLIENLCLKFDRIYFFLISHRTHTQKIVQDIFISFKPIT